MADSKITDLTTGNPAQSGDEIPINRAGADRKVTAASIAALTTGVSDGDKGDVAVSSSGSVWTVESVGGRTFTTADAGADALFGWDDSASAYQNLSATDARAAAAAAASATTVTAGAGLTGGGDLSANRTLDVGAGTGIQVNANDVAIGDAELLALAGLTSAANKVPRFTGSGTADLLDFKDEDDMASNSATALPSQQSVKAYVDANLGHEVLTASRTYYVRTDGSDSNTGLVNSSGGAFLTIQHAVDVVGALDFNNDSTIDVTIQIIAGTYNPAATINLPPLANMDSTWGVVILGDETTPSNINITKGFLASGGESRWFLAGLKINHATGTSILVHEHATVNFQNIYFTGGARCILATRYGNAFLDTNNPTLSSQRTITVDGPIRNFAQAIYHGTVDAVFDDLVLIGTPAITDSWLDVSECSLCYWFVNNSTTGTATGYTFNVRSGGVIQDYGGGVPPGNVDGILYGTGSYNSNLEGYVRLVELGHPGDTSITRVSPGIIAVEGDTVALLAKENQALVGGATVTEKDLGTVTTGTTTLDMGDRPMHKYVNNGAHTLAPGAVIGSTLVAITNGASAGAITTSGWTKVAGDSFTTTNAHKFICHASVSAVGSLLSVQAMQ